MRRGILKAGGLYFKMWVPQRFRSAFEDAALGCVSVWVCFIQ